MLITIMTDNTPDMPGERDRTNDGTLREKRGDTHASTIEKEYGVDLDCRGDKQLSTILDDRGLDSFSDLID